MRTPRVAFFPDSYPEVNGVAHTSRLLVEFAADRNLPMLCVHGSHRSEVWQRGPVTFLELARGPASISLERDLRFDPLLWRHRDFAASVFRAFAPDVVHVTGPSDVGQLGAYLAHRGGLPLLASWHTNLHDFAAMRFERVTRMLPGAVRRRVTAAVRRKTLALVLDFYKIARRVLAPNQELAALLAARTGRPTGLMPRGVDSQLFSPVHRNVDDSIFRLGYVGRLSPEKGVRRLAEVERLLLQVGWSNLRFVIVGDGSQRGWLEKHLRHAEFRGVLRGANLARAYADLDLLVFPSETDTFGNVVLEALASGTPAAVMDRGGPRFLVRHGVTGFVASDARGLADAADALLSDRARRRAMGEAARRRALEASWASVFEGVYESYRTCVADTLAHSRLAGSGASTWTARLVSRMAQASR